MNEGWIKIHRNITKWEWYEDSKTVHLFFHLLVSANHKDGKWKGQEVKRGQVITGRKKLSAVTGISERSIRTCLERLESTNEVTIKTTSKNSVITIVKYDFYQGSNISDQPVDQQTTNERPANDQRTTTNKNDNNVNNEKNEKNEKIIIYQGLDFEKKEVFDLWINYRIEIKKTIKVQSTIKNLIDKFNSNTLEDCIRAVNSSIDNQYTGLFWNNKNNSNGESKQQVKQSIIELAINTPDGF